MSEQRRGWQLAVRKVACWGLREAKGWVLEITSGSGGVSGMHCRMESTNTTWETENLGQVLLLLLIKFVSWDKWPHHSETQFFQGQS